MKAIAAFLAAIVASSATAAAQCFVPDGLNGPCCAPAVSNLPALPAYTMPGLAVCFHQCQVMSTPCIKWDFGVPSPTSCDGFKVDVKVIDCSSGFTRLFGTVVLDYTRTWMEQSTSGPIQVWRFAAKVDMAANVAIPPDPCITPPSALAFPQIFYYGYIDYAFDCTSGTWEMATVLAHQCDWLIHGTTGFSSTPGIHHPARFYALVGPDTPGNPFVPVQIQAPFGGLAGEATRETATPGTVCNAEEPLQGAISPLFQACLCAPAMQPPRAMMRRLVTSGQCGTQVASIDTLPMGLPWPHLVTTSIGTWTTMASFPGPEAVWLDEGPVLHAAGCPDATGVTPVHADVMYGVTTAKGYPAVPGTPPHSAMTDLASNWSWTLGTPITIPMYGNVMPTRRLVYVTMP
jgi:hypothetical protein